MNIKNYPLSIEIAIPLKPCVYLLTNDNGDILYVGSSKKNTLGRIATHKYDKQFSRVFIMQCKGYKEMEEMENNLIFKIKPTYNRQVKNNNSTGLLSVKDIKKQLPCDGRIITNSASRYDIEMVSIGSQRFYDKKIIKAIVDYIDNQKRKPLSWGRIHK